MKLSNKIAELRKSKNWSQEQLAEKLDVSRQAVYKWEADINQPDLDKLKKIAHIFNISYNVLMDDDMDLPLFEQIAEAENGEIQNEQDSEAKEALIQESHTGKPNKKKAKKILAKWAYFLYNNSARKFFRSITPHTRGPVAPVFARTGGKE